MVQYLRRLASSMITLAMLPHRGGSFAMAKQYHVQPTPNCLPSLAPFMGQVMVPLRTICRICVAWWQQVRMIWAAALLTGSRTLLVQFLGLVAVNKTTLFPLVNLLTTIIVRPALIVVIFILFHLEIPVICLLLLVAVPLALLLLPLVQLLPLSIVP